MNRREVIECEIDAFAAWRVKNFDYPESVAHMKYVELLGWEAEKQDRGNK